MKQILLTLALAGIFSFVYADKGDTKTGNSTETQANIELTGKIIDLKSGEILTGVEVRLEGTDTKTYTDFDGNYSFSNLKPGQYNIAISFISYEKKQVENIAVNKENNKIDFKLQPTN